MRDYMMKECVTKENTVVQTTLTVNVLVDVKDVEKVHDYWIEWRAMKRLSRRQNVIDEMMVHSDKDMVLMHHH
jgi:hypothetical protein